MRVPDLDLDLLRCFITVIESGGFTKASKQLHLTQPAITLKIKRLEEVLQTRLFSRTTSPLKLTSDGEIVVGYAIRLLSLNGELVERLSKSSKRPGAMRLGIVHHFGYHALPLWLAEFRRSRPELPLITDMGLTHELLAGLEEDRFDVVIASAGFTAMSEYKVVSLIQETHLQTESLVWVQAKRSKIDPKLDPLPLVMFGPLCRFRPICLEALREAKRSWEIVYDGGSLQSVQAAVEADLGLSVLNSMSLTTGLRVPQKSHNLPPLPTVGLAIYHRKDESQQAIQSLTTHLIDSVRRWQQNALESKMETNPLRRIS